MSQKEMDSMMQLTSLLLIVMVLFQETQEQYYKNLVIYQRQEMVKVSIETFTIRMLLQMSLSTYLQVYLLSMESMLIMALNQFQVD